MVANIKLRLEGPEENQYHLDLDVFHRKIAEFKNFLDESIKAIGSKGIKFNVVNISHSSPMAIECELVDTEQTGSNDSQVIELIGSSLTSISQTQSEQLGHDVLVALGKLSHTTQGEQVSVDVQINGNTRKKSTYLLNEDFHQKILNLQDSEEGENSMNTIKGIIKGINIKNGRVFRIYSTFWDNASAKCFFSEEMLENVRAGLGKNVLVTGMCKFSGRARFPFEIKVHEIEVLPENKEPLSFLDLRGIAPNSTGDKTSVEFVRGLRDEWDS